MSVRETNSSIHSIEIYPVGDVIHLLNNWDQAALIPSIPISLFISLACFSGETQKMKVFRLSAPIVIMVPGVETAETGDKYLGVTRTMQGRLLQIKDVELFRNGSVREFYRLKALINLKQVNT